jgi:hypothetical protein
MYIIITAMIVIGFIAGLMVWSEWQKRKLMSPFNPRLDKEADKLLEKHFIKQLMNK